MSMYRRAVRQRSKKKRPLSVNSLDERSRQSLMSQLVDMSAIGSPNLAPSATTSGQAVHGNPALSCSTSDISTLSWSRIYRSKSDGTCSSYDAAGAASLVETGPVLAAAAGRVTRNMTNSVIFSSDLDIVSCGIGEMARHRTAAGPHVELMRAGERWSTGTADLQQGQGKQEGLTASKVLHSSSSARDALVTSSTRHTRFTVSGTEKSLEQNNMTESSNSCNKTSTKYDSVDNLSSRGKSLPNQHLCYIQAHKLQNRAGLRGLTGNVSVDLKHKLSPTSTSLPSNRVRDPCCFSDGHPVNLDRQHDIQQHSSHNTEQVRRHSEKNPNCGKNFIVSRCQSGLLGSSCDNGDMYASFIPLSRDRASDSRQIRREKELIGTQEQMTKFFNSCYESESINALENGTSIQRSQSSSKYGDTESGVQGKLQHSSVSKSFWHSTDMSRTYPSGCGRPEDDWMGLQRDAVSFPLDYLQHMIKTTTTVNMTTRSEILGQGLSSLQQRQYHQQHSSHRHHHSHRHFQQQQQFQQNHQHHHQHEQLEQNHYYQQTQLQQIHRKQQQQQLQQSHYNPQRTCQLYDHYHHQHHQQGEEKMYEELLNSSQVPEISLEGILLANIEFVRQRMAAGKQPVLPEVHHRKICLGL
ncbi:hypothetical protein ElyMa_005326900 [Elysia marginata]|uniref:Uncharacterized protein n=1 Tax=Elysia marginata TaxID=1093978 RepID=A0AAV4K166_9GAST|nr:hypothetical protein ElyMa_005326900 [Elysia marginata]